MKKINEWFICKWCGHVIEPANRTSRNHCPDCFLSLHVDDKLPGDRESSCNGEMVPVEYKVANGQIKIRFVCIVCGKEHRNRTASDDKISDLDNSINRWKIKLETSSVRPPR